MPRSQVQSHITLLYQFLCAGLNLNCNAQFFEQLTSRSCDPVPVRLKHYDCCGVIGPIDDEAFPMLNSGHQAEHLLPSVSYGQHFPHVRSGAYPM